MKSETVGIVINGRPARVAAGASLASVLLNERVFEFRESVSDEPRAPLCGMGVCYECRVTIDGIEHQRACMTVVRDGMRVETASTRQGER